MEEKWYDQLEEELDYEDPIDYEELMRIIYTENNNEAS